MNGSVSATTFVGDGSALTGVGKITTVTAGSGLTGGGSAGSVSLTIDSTVARTNASNTFTANQTVDGSGTANSDPGIFYFWGREVETALTISPSARDGRNAGRCRANFIGAPCGRAEGESRFAQLRPQRSCGSHSTAWPLSPTISPRLLMSAACA